MQQKCRACGCEQDCEETGEASEAAPLPKGWYVRHIDYTDYVLCDVCGAISHFNGGLSPYLMEALELNEYVSFDISDEVAKLCETRRSLRNRRKKG